MSNPTEGERDAARYIEAARAHYADDDIEIDDDPQVSESGPGGDGGMWVQAWVWVADHEVENSE